MRMSELWADTAHLSSLPSEEDIKRAGEILLRDQFAMAALTGLLSNPKLADTALKKGPRWFDEIAYQYADGMLKEREAK
jgi:hypothetical protein